MLLIATALLLGQATSELRAPANQPPSRPVVIEPGLNQIVHPANVHLSTSGMIDLEGDGHASSDWEIWTADPLERIWFARGDELTDLVSAQLSDGIFIGSYAGRRELQPDLSYRMRVRHRDEAGMVSAFSERAFRTAGPTEVPPLFVRGVSPRPNPTWKTRDGLHVQAAFPTAKLRLEGPSRQPLLQMLPGERPQLVRDSGLPEPLRVVVRAQSTSTEPLRLPESDLAFTDQRGIDRVVHIPKLELSPGSSHALWVADHGATYHGGLFDPEPRFTQFARANPIPWRVVLGGYGIEIAAGGFQLPMNLAFVREPGPAPTDTLYYVVELTGTIWKVANDGTVDVFVDNLLNFDPNPQFPGSGELGLSGILIDPFTDDVLAVVTYDPLPPSSVRFAKIVRFPDEDPENEQLILDIPAHQGPAHYVSNLSLGPEFAIYVHTGDSYQTSQATNIDSFLGKVLRINLDGSPHDGNPFYEIADGLTARDYVYATGFRNPFGGAWWRGKHFSVENGPFDNDRFARVDFGGNYGWDGNVQSMVTGALYNWRGSGHAPVNILFMDPERFGGSGFPGQRLDNAFVTKAGPTYANGLSERAKRIEEFILHSSGTVLAGPFTFVEYIGGGRATTCALAQGPDGLYFTDLYKDLGAASPFDAGGNVLRVFYVGYAQFRAADRRGPDPLEVEFEDISNVPGASAWFWDFGDGNTSTEQNPVHVYTEPGVYDVRLEVTGTHGVAPIQRNGYVSVIPGSLPVR